MQEVELLDGDDDVVEQPQAPARSRRRLWWIPAGAVAVALSLVAVQVVVDAREDAAAERLAAVPGVYPPLGDELEVVRAITPAEGNRLWASIEIGAERTAALLVAEDGSQSFTAVDQRTGETLWSTPLLGPNAQRAAAVQNSWGGWCLGDTPPGEPATVAACLVTDGFLRYEDDGTEERMPATSSRVVVLDTRDGHVIAEWGTEPTAQLAVLDGLTVVGTRDPERGAVVIAHDLRSGDERWRYERPLVDSPDGAPESYWGLLSAGDTVGISDGETITLLSSTGSVVRSDVLDSSGGGFTTDPITGAFAIVTNAGRTTTLLAPDADPADDVVVRGQILYLSVDDGSLPDLVLTSESHLYASDRTTGEEVWEADLQPDYSALVIRGRVYVTTTTEVVALDGRTGEVEWRTPQPASGGGSLATDSRDLLLLSSEYDGSGSGTVSVLDLASGDELRRIPYPVGVDQLQLMHGMLLGWAFASEEVVIVE